MLGKTAILISNNYQAFHRRLALQLKLLTKVNLFFPHSQSKFIQHFKQVSPSFVLATQDVNQLNQLQVPEDCPLIQIRNCSKDGYYLHSYHDQKTVKSLGICNQRQLSERISSFLQQKGTQYCSQTIAEGSKTLGDIRVINTNYHGPLTEIQMQWLTNELQKAFYDDQVKLVCLSSNDFIFVQIQNPSVGIKFSHLLKILNLKKKPLVLLLSGQIAGEGNLLLLLADLVFARKKTIIFPYSKICNFPFLMNQHQKYKPFFQNRYPEFLQENLLLQKLDISYLIKAQRTTPLKDFDAILKKYQKTAMLKAVKAQLSSKEHNVGRFDVIRDTPICIKINCFKYIHHKLDTSIRPKIKRLKQFCTPTICIFHVTKTHQSQVYVRKKKQIFEREGFRVIIQDIFEENNKKQNLLDNIQKANSDSSIHGIIIQLPINQMDQMQILQTIAPVKNIDGFSFRNFGMLSLGGKHEDCILPCTLRGIVGLLDFYKIKYISRKIAIVGKGITIGTPAHLFFSARGATLTACDVNTVNLDQIVSRSDIIICATDQQNIINAQCLNQHSIVIDAGFKVTSDGQLRGNLDHKSVREGCFTTVPGGIGSITVVEAMENTLDAFFKINKLN